MHFDPRLPFAVLLAALTFFHTSAEFHFCACRHELPAAPLCFRFSIENEVECCVLSNFILSLFSLAVGASPGDFQSEHVLLKVLCWNVYASSSRDVSRVDSPGQVGPYTEGASVHLLSYL